MCVVGAPFDADVIIQASAHSPSFLLLVNAPHFATGGGMPLMTSHVPHVEADTAATDNDADLLTYRITARLKPFSRPGFYDWAVVSIGSNGEPTTACLHPSGKPAQGRYIVHPASCASQSVRQVVVDLQGMDVDAASGAIRKHGTFADVEASLGDMASAGASSLFIVGALERDNGWGDGDGALAAQNTTTHAHKSDGEDSDERYGCVHACVI